MRKYGTWAVMIVLGGVLGTSWMFGAPADDSSDPVLPEFNRVVLKIIAEYPTDGTHKYWWPRGSESDYTGGTTDLFFQGKQVMKGDKDKQTYCCGLTLEVFLRSYQEWLGSRGGESAAAFSADDWPRFQKLWFVENKNGPGPSAALEAFGLGRAIKPSEALPGDFVQIWRTETAKGKVSGHSVVFLDWVRNESGDAIGFEYWSTQPGTNGISKRVEYYGPLGGMSTEYTHFGRVEPKAGKGKDASSS